MRLIILSITAQTQIRLQAKQRGLSLIELMIAIALGLLLTLGVTQIYLSGSATYRQSQGLSHAQESTRFVSAILKPELRAAGSFGCVADMGRPLNQVVDNRFQGPLPMAISQAVRGWEYENTGPANNITLPATLTTPIAAKWKSGTTEEPLPTDLVGSVVSNSDVIIVNAIAQIPVPVKATTPVSNSNSINLDGSSGLPMGRVVLAATGDCSEAEVFQKTNAANGDSITMAGGNVSPGNNGNQFNLNYDSETRVYEFISMAYYVGVGTNKEPALFRRRMAPLENSQELVSGVETFQILYGLDTGGSSAADTYVTADAVDNWNRVASVRFAVMTRSREEVLDEADTRTFNILGSATSQGNDADRRARLVSAGTAALRGRM